MGGAQPCSWRVLGIARQIMLLSISAIPDPADLAPIGDLIVELEWRDGRETAGKTARQVKQNEQALMNTPAGQKLRDVLFPLIKENAVVKAAARPRRYSSLMVSKTANGGHYGSHIDNALMGAGKSRMRTDVSFTLFLSNAADYEGGELVIHSATGTQAIKGEAGQLVLYPSTSIHEVKPVTSGERIVCVGWIESLIPDPTQRELLFDLENLRVSLRKSLPATSPERLTLDKSIANLLRMWSQP